MVPAVEADADGWAGRKRGAEEGVDPVDERVSERRLARARNAAMRSIRRRVSTVSEGSTGVQTDPATPTRSLASCGVLRAVPSSEEREAVSPKRG
jgi:hypothetical protein